MNKRLSSLLLTIFIDMLGVGILIPVIPQLLGEPNSQFYLLASGEQRMGYILLGLLVAIYPIAIFFMSPILGALSDRVGRKPVLVISILGTSISYFIFAFAIFTKNIPLLFLSRLVDGMTGGNISVAQAAIADSSSIENRTKAFGLMGAAFGAGFIFGPFLGGVLSSPDILPFFSAYTPFIFAGLISLLNVFFIKFFFQESIKEKHPGRKIDFFASIKNIVKASKFHMVRELFLVSFLFNFGFSFFTSFFNVYLTDKFNFSSIQIGNFFAYVGFWIVITQLLVVRRVSEKFSEPQVLRWAYLWCGLATACYLLPAHAWQLLFVVPFASIPNGLQLANFNSLLTKRTDENIRGEIMGIGSSVSSLGQSIPPLLAGVIAAFTASYMPVVIAAVIVFCAGIVFITKVKRA